MTDIQIDQEYLDDAFIERINNTENEALSSLLNALLQNYESEFTYEKIEKFNNLCKTIYANEVNAEHFLRQLKYLFNKGIYGRINKKYRADLAALKIEEEKIGILAEAQKKFYEQNIKKNEERNKEEYYHVKDFDMLTEMPIHYSDYKIYNEENRNDDIKKQNLFINFKLSEGDKENNCLLSIDKEKLIGMYEQIEKLQEKLDKLS